MMSQCRPVSVNCSLLQIARILLAHKKCFHELAQKETKTLSRRFVPIISFWSFLSIVFGMLAQARAAVSLHSENAQMHVVAGGDHSCACCI